MLLRVVILLIGGISLLVPAAAQERVLEPPLELFHGVADSTEIYRKYAEGFMEASSIMLGRQPGRQLRLWRQASHIAPEDLFVPELMWRQFGIRLEAVDVDTLTSAEWAYYVGYSAAVEGMLKREVGIDVLEKIEEEARVQYRLYRERSIPSGRRPE